MEKTVSLEQFAVGERGCITSISACHDMRQRLDAMGVIVGTELTCVLKGPSGEPIAFEVRGSIFALRAADCRSIHLKRLGTTVVRKGNPAITMILAGNPNVGKSTVFNALTGMRQHTGNWCGKTVSSAKGQFCYHGQTIQLFDTPGTYSLLSHTAEEVATRNTLCQTPHECVICVCDATCLERGVILALQILEMHSKLVLCVNLMDEAKKKGIQIDLDALSNALGVPVVGVTARKKKTLLPLLEAAVKQTTAPVSSKPPLVLYPDAVERAIHPLEDTLAVYRSPNAMASARWAAIRLLMPPESDNSTICPLQMGISCTGTDALQLKVSATTEALANNGFSQTQLENVVAASTILKAASICKQVVIIPPNASERDRAIDRVVTSRRFGYPLMILLLFLVLWLTIQGANVPSMLLSRAMDTLCQYATSAANALQFPWWLTGALVDGMMRGTGWVISVMLPPMAIFFPLFTLLEDTGFLPRIAFHCDHCFSRCRACGKQSLTMAMGFGCNAVGVTESRIIDSKRERLLSILTNSLVPCNGRFPPRIEGNNLTCDSVVFSEFCPVLKEMRGIKC